MASWDVAVFSETAGEGEMEFSEKLKIMRREAGLTQEELAQRLFLTRQAISNYEQGRGCPSVDTLLRMSELFGVGLDELLSSARAKRAAQTGLVLLAVVLVSLFAVTGVGFLLSAQAERLLFVLLGGVYLLPACYAFFGAFLFCRPPEKPTPWLGFRTKTSMKNGTLWLYAQARCAAALLRLAVCSFLCTDCLSLVFAACGAAVFVVGSVVLVCLQTGGVLYPLLYTHVKLRRFGR